MYTYGIPAHLSGAVHSPRMDSLRTLVGSVPESVSSMDLDEVMSLDAQLGAVGAMRFRGGKQPEMFLNTSSPLLRDKANTQETLAHEMGHYAQYNGVTSPLAGAMNTLPPIRELNPRFVSRSPLPFMANGNEKNAQSRRPLMNSYAASSDDERSAQAFANAFDYLQRTASDTTDWRGKIGAYEATSPGMGDIARILMAQPIYSNHPLKKQIR